MLHRTLVTALLFSLLAACSREESAPAVPAAAAPPPTAASAGATGDPYDVTKMDFKPPPAVISAGRHTGAFAMGNSLSMDATVKPLDPADRKSVV